MVTTSHNILTEIILLFLEGFCPVNGTPNVKRIIEIKVAEFRDDLHPEV